MRKQEGQTCEIVRPEKCLLPCSGPVLTRYGVNVGTWGSSSPFRFHATSFQQRLRALLAVFKPFCATGGARDLSCIPQNQLEKGFKACENGGWLQRHERASRDKGLLGQPLH